MSTFTKTLAASALFITVAAPASALVDPALEQQFLEAATRAVQQADIAAGKALLDGSVDAVTDVNSDTEKLDVYDDTAAPLN